MKKHKLITKPMPLSEIDLDNLVDNDEEYWDTTRYELKRWRELKNSG